MEFKATILLVLAALSCANALYSLVPENKELVYHYNGLVKAGTHIPTSYASVMVLDGKLHIQTDMNSTFIRFSDLKYKLDNGEFDEFHNDWSDFDSKEIALPQELKDFEKVFRVVYDVNGKGMGIATETEEELYVVNVKKAIASMLQMDVEQVGLDSVKTHAFITEEHSIYGHGRMYYNVMPIAGTLLVEKMHEMKSTRHMYKHLFTNLEMEYCKADFDEPLTHDSQKIYKIIKKDGMSMVESIESTGGMYYHPFQAESNAYHVYVNQTMELLTVKPVEAKLEVKSEKYYPGFTYFAGFMNEKDGSIVDVTNGRREWSMEKLMPTIEKMMHDIVEYLNHDHIHMEEPNYEHGQLINYIVKLMIHLDLPTFEKMHETLLQKMTEQDKKYLEVYYHLLPMIGTHDSMRHIMKIVREKKVKEFMALEMIQAMAFHIKFPTNKFLTEMDFMMNMPADMSLPIRKACILSFATLMHKSMEMRKRFTNEQQMMWYGQEHYHHEFMPEQEKIEKFYPAEIAYEKYITEFINKLKTAKDLDMQILYFNAMYNTRMEMVMHKLIPAAMGEWFDNHYLRFLAGFTIFPSIAKHEELVYKVYWPMMADITLPTSLRVMGYYFMMETHPSLSRMMNIYWQMQDEPNQALYQFHYSYIKAMARTTDPCRQDFSMRCKQVLKYTPKPEFYSMSGYYQMDFMDAKYGFGSAIRMMFIDGPNETEKMFTFTMSTLSNKLQVNQMTYLVRVEGMEGSIFDDFQLDLTTPTNMFNYENVMKIYSNIPNNKDMKLSIIAMDKDQTVMTYNFDGSNVKELSSFFDFFFAPQYTYMKKYIHFNYLVSNVLVFPTEMGFPAMFEILMPLVRSNEIKINKEVVNKMITYKMDNRWQTWSHYIAGISFYNPIADIWHGVHKVQSYDAVFPMYMDLTINPAQNTMKFSWKRHDKEEDDIMGFRSHVTTMVSVYDHFKHDVLKQSSPTSKPYEMVTHGDEYRHNYTIFHKECANTGLHYHMGAYDSERYFSNGTIRHFISMMTTPHTKSFATPMGQQLLSWMNMMEYMYLQPVPVTNGFMFRAEPSKEFPTTNIDLTLRMNTEYKNTDMILMPGMKFNVRGTWAVKKNDKALKTWDCNVIMDRNPGHTVMNMKMQLTRLIPGQKDYKICMDYSSKMTKEQLTGQMNMAMSTSADGKCTKDETVIDVTMLAERSEEQREGNHVYRSCYKPIWSDIHEENSLECYADHSSLRKYTFNIKSTKMPTEFKKTIAYWMDTFKGYNMPYYTYIDEPTEKMEVDNMKIELEYPMAGKLVDVRMFTPEHEYEFTSIPAYNWLYLAAHPFNTQFSKIFRFMHYFGLTETCFVDEEALETFAEQTVDFKLPNEWTMYLGDVEKDSKRAVYVKNIEGTDKIAVKFMYKTHVLEILPKEDKKYEFVLDGQKLADNLYFHSEDWFHYDLMKETDVISMVMHPMGIHIVFDGHHLRMEIPQSELELFGKCTMKV